MQRGIPSALIRGGTSRGLYFLAEHLPDNDALRDQVLLAAMGSPDVRQIDGVGGAHPLTSKVAVISTSTHAQADVDYLFLQVQVDKAVVSDAQNCGNILAGVGPFAIEQGLVSPLSDITPVRIYMRNTKSIAVAHVLTPGGIVQYEGDAHIDGVPGTAAPIMIDFIDVAGSSCGALLPTGNRADRFDGYEVTCIDNGMPVVLLNAADFGLSGDESPMELESNKKLTSKIESIRLQAGKAMCLGDVEKLTVPKMSLLSKPKMGGIVKTQTLIPHRVHEAIGVLGAVSVATGCIIQNTVAQNIINRTYNAGAYQLDIEHPTGVFTVGIEFEDSDGNIEVKRSGLLRTARKLMQGEVFVPESAWKR